MATNTPKLVEQIKEIRPVATAPLKTREESPIGAIIDAAFKDPEITALDWQSVLELDDSAVNTIVIEKAEMQFRYNCLDSKTSKVIALKATEDSNPDHRQIGITMMNKLLMEKAYSPDEIKDFVSRNLTSPHKIISAKAAELVFSMYFSGEPILNESEYFNVLQTCICCRNNTTNEPIFPENVRKRMTEKTIQLVAGGNIYTDTAKNIAKALSEDPSKDLRKMGKELETTIEKERTILTPATTLARDFLKERDILVTAACTTPQKPHKKLTITN